MTRRERMENRLERRLDWAESRERDSTARYNAAKNIGDGIPMGQPILVGHHSERYHRRDIARIDSNMRACVESGKMAERHTQVAATLEHRLETTIFSDDDNAIEALQAKIAGLEAERERIKVLNKAIRRETKAGLTDGWLARTGATEAEQREILNNYKIWGRNYLFPAYVASNIGGRIQQAKKRIAQVGWRNKQAAQAEAAGGVNIQIHRLASSPDSDWATITFAEKPPREILDALRNASFQWGGGSWGGYASKLPAAVTE